MEPDGRTYLLPHPLVARVILTLAGAFAMVMAPLELWRGLWPVSLVTPFFAVIVFGAMGVGAAFVYCGLFASSARLEFSPGRVDIQLSNPWGSSRRTIYAEDIAGFSVEERENSEGPNDWRAVINVLSGQPIMSRPLATKQAAESQLAQFRLALAQTASAPPT